MLGGFTLGSTTVGGGISFVTDIIIDDYQRRRGGPRHDKIKLRPWVYPQEKEGFSKDAMRFIQETVINVLDTGVVLNPHKPYDPTYNPRVPVSEERAQRIATKIAKNEGYDVEL